MTIRALLLFALVSCTGRRDDGTASFAYRRQALNDLILFRAQAQLMAPIDGCRVFKLLDNDPNYLERLGTAQKQLIAQRAPAECGNNAVFYSAERLVVEQIVQTRDGVDIIARFVRPGHSHRETHFLKAIHSGNQGTPSFSVEFVSFGEFA